MVADGIHRETAPAGHVVHYQCAGQLRADSGISDCRDRLPSQHGLVCLQVPGVTHRIRVHGGLADDAEVLGVQSQHQLDDEYVAHGQLQHHHVHVGCVAVLFWVRVLGVVHLLALREVLDHTEQHPDTLLVG